MSNFRRTFLVIVSLFLFIGTMAGNIPEVSAASMTASDECIQFIKKIEGFSPQPFYDYNQYTVGYGTKCPSEKYFEYTANGIPKSDAEKLLREHIEDIEETIHKKIIQKYDITLTQHQFDALISFSFNIGTGWMTYNSTLRNAILGNASANELVYAFGLYCTAGGKYLPGLITRRLCEANIYLNGTYSKNVSNKYGYVYYDANGGTLTYRVQGFVCEDNPLPLTDVARPGDVFLGWYTELNGGTQVTNLSRAVNGKTLFARWQSSETAEPEDINNTTVQVTGDIVNIRKGPGTNYSVVKQVYQNTVLNVSHVTHLTTMRWGKVEDGWISLDYTNYDEVINGTSDSVPEAEQKPSDDPTASENNSGQSNTGTEPSVNPDAVWGTVHVNDLLRIRSGPGVTYSVVGFLFNGREVEILEQTTNGSMGWGRISRGWVSMDYIETAEAEPEKSKEEVEATPEAIPDDSPTQSESTEISGRIKADALRIRAGAGIQYPIVGFLYENDTVTIYEKKLIGDVYWGKTSKGWINMDYVQTDAVQEAPTQPAEGKTMKVIGDCLRVRKGTGTEYKISELLYYGDRITILETKDVDGVLWGRVHNGWVCMDYVE